MLHDWPEFRGLFEQDCRLLPDVMYNGVSGVVLKAVSGDGDVLLYLRMA